MYTIGEFGRKTGISTRTLRFYEELGILYPSARNESGHRLYGLDELAKLQRIQSLKFIGYSLQEIKDMLADEEITIGTFSDSLPIQKKILEHKREEINQAIHAIDHVQSLLDDDLSLNWTILSSLLYQQQFEEDQKEWLEENFSEDFVRMFYDMPKEQRQQLDREWLFIFNDVKELMKNNVPPEAPEAQELLLRFSKLLMETVSEEVLLENVDALEQAVESGDMTDFNMPSFWTPEEEAYLDEVIKVMEEQHKEEE